MMFSMSMTWFLLGDPFSRSDVVFCGVYQYIGVSTNLTALPQNWQGGATVKEKHTENSMSEQSVLFQKAEQS